MVQGGATDTGYSEELIENIVKYISRKEDLLQQLEKLLKLNGLQKEGEIFDESAIKHVSELLMKDKDLLENAIDIVKEYLEKNNNELKILLEQVNKVKGMEGKLEALGNQLLVQGVIGGAAVTTLTGALAGLLTIGGVTGALMGGGIALAGFVALVAIAAIGYAIYQHRGEIKEGAIEAGKAVKSFVKNVIDKLPTIQDRNKNFYKLHQELSQLALQTGTEDNKIKNIQDKAKVIEMLQNEEQQSAIKKLVEEEVIQNFSKEDMKKLVEKGNSTHEEDMKVLDDLINKFQPAIMAIGSDIKEVEQKVNEKAQKVEPSSQIDSPSPEQASTEENKTL
ncbi:MAG: glycine zipper family protein [Wolbachia endosymbiont of Andrena nigroaenea]|uniref:glycine zipper family protein n=1 Tax=Wolbachia endosymbiont (group A) of Andrena hattorfiana TaxID=2953977 RepID=UPI0021F83DFD|nr:glycine zipper family protein [Wolbachia endosymbiont (group A) of Andrena hattorfiana]MDX5527084.1 glycine zipper family protein [Wolbachia endosymbiont of Andrena nigroaenea]